MKKASVKGKHSKRRGVMSHPFPGQHCKGRLVGGEAGVKREMRHERPGQGCIRVAVF